MNKLEPMDYGRVVSAKKLKGSGLSLGDVVMVMGTKQVPASSKDPYITRTLVTVVLLENNLPALPKQDNNHMAYLVDPRSLDKVVGEEVETYKAAIELEYNRRST